MHRLENMVLIIKTALPANLDGMLYTVRRVKLRPALYAWLLLPALEGVLCGECVCICVCVSVQNAYAA